MAVTKRAVNEFVKTGISGLDTIFLGGITSKNMILVEGAPGTGKTTLGMEFIYRGAKDFKENGLIISFESSEDRLLRDARAFGWDFEGLKRKKGMVKIIHTNPSLALQELIAPESFLIDEIKRINAKRILIDGLTPLKLFAEILKGRSFRDSLYMLVENLQKLGVTAVLTRELPRLSQDMVNSTDEQYVCDTIITLSNFTDRRNTHRYIEIKKSRGQNYIQGQHTFQFVPGEGIKVYQRCQSRPRTFTQQPTSTERHSTGIPTLDQIIGGGVYEGSVTLVVGISGTGKSVMGMEFLKEGVNLGKRGLMISLDEHPKQILRNARTLGLGFEEQVRKNNIFLLCDSPIELEMDIHFEKIVQFIEENNIERVVVDSVVGYQNTNNEEAQQFIYSLATYFKSKLITAYFNYESPELLGLSQISEDLKASAIVDNIILLNYVEISTQMRRAITVPKARGTSIPQKTREFIIERGGIRVLDEEFNEEIEEVPQLPFSSYYGVLSRAPARHSPLIESRIMKGEELPDSPKMN